MSELNQINRAAFAQEQADVMKAIAAQPKREKLPADVGQLANKLGHAGVPVAAAVELARRLVHVPADFWQHVQRLEGRVIELEKEVAALRSARR